MRTVSLPNKLLSASLLILLCHLLHGQQRTIQGRKLFTDTSLLKVEVLLPLDSITSDDCKNPQYFNGRIFLKDEGQSHEIKVKARKRAKFRCDPANCSLPPFMLKIDPGDAHGTVFQGCKKLKITHTCRPEKKGYQNLVYKEYLVYRIFNKITDSSFRVRLAHLTYRKMPSGEVIYKVYGFFIEDDDDLARRMGAKVLNATNLSDEWFDPAMLFLTALFEYMIGNTDYNIETAHNIEVLALGGKGHLFPVPYDFDWSGLVNAPYAHPALHTGLTQVTQRWYQGPCPSDTVLSFGRQRLLDRKEVIKAEIVSFNLLTSKEKKQMLNYIEKFYNELNQPVRFGKMVHKTCRKPASNAK